MGCVASKAPPPADAPAPRPPKEPKEAKKAENQAWPSEAVSSGQVNVELKAGMFIGEKEGKVTDMYSLGKKLGDGAYGCVRVAVLKSNPTVTRAVKSILKESVGKAEERDKLFAEVSVLKQLDHPNIMRLYEFFEDDKNYHLVMELYTGGELFDKIVELNSFSEAGAADVMKQLLSGIAYCHSKNIVHRDLKPENLLLESKDPDAPIKIVDFGTSRVFDPSAEKKMNEKLGTPYYVAPEVLRKKYDEKCDVWSCGVILYVLLSGSPPFGGANDDEILMNVRKGEFDLASEGWAGISEEPKELIRQMLTKEPQKRLTAQEAFDNPWVQKGKGHGLKDNEQAVMGAVMKQLHAFKVKQKMQHAALVYIAAQLTSKEERDQLTRAFKSIDTNGDGSLSRDELIDAYTKTLGSTAAAVEEVDNILKAADADGNGRIDYTEFLVASMDKSAMCRKENLDAAFFMFDKDGSGKISAEELAKLFGVGDKITADLWNTILKDVDKNADGEVNLEEFKAMMIKSLS